MAWRNVLNYTYSGTKLFNSYPIFYWIEHVWKLDCMLDQPDQQKQVWPHATGLFWVHVHVSISPTRRRVSTPPHVWRESPLHPMYGGESPLHSEEVLEFNLVLWSNPFQSKGWSPIENRVDEPILELFNAFIHLATSYFSVNALRGCSGTRGFADMPPPPFSSTL